jgi:hypothetical protein
MIGGTVVVQARINHVDGKIPARGNNHLLSIILLNPKKELKTACLRY